MCPAQWKCVKVGIPGQENALHHWEVLHENISVGFGAEISHSVTDAQLDGSFQGRRRGLTNVTGKEKAYLFKKESISQQRLLTFHQILLKPAKQFSAALAAWFKGRRCWSVDLSNCFTSSFCLLSVSIISKQDQESTAVRAPLRDCTARTHGFTPPTVHWLYKDKICNRGFIKQAFYLTIR